MSHETRNRRAFLRDLGLAAGAGLLGTRALTNQGRAAEEPELSDRRPNLLVIVTDDQRWDAMGCAGNPIIQTPAMDRLARGGVLFRQNFCTTSICMTSRASILTGNYAQRHGINSFAEPLPPEKFARTYPVLLREAGYRTGFVGKWGLGGPLPKDDFDYFRGFSGQGQYFQDVDGEQVHLTRIMTKNALGFLEDGDTDRPWCLSISTKAPHVQDGHPDPFRFDPALADLYADVEIPPAPVSAPKYFEMLPEFLQTSEGRVRWEQRFATPEMYQHSVKNYYRLITGVDRMLARIVETLEKSGQTDNTVIVFTSDNGFFLGEHGLAGKWFMYEESIRTPLIIFDPRLPNEYRGTECNQMTLNIDIAPTLLEYGGVTIPAGMRGDSLRRTMGGHVRLWRSEFYYEHMFKHPRIPPSEGVRDERWKLVRYVDRDPVYEQLFDLENDPHEINNLAGAKEHRDRLDAMRSRCKHWRELVG
jgi:arylsulfatase A-like enzyme